MALAAAKGLILLLLGGGLALTLGADDKPKPGPLGGPGPTGEPLPEGLLCVAPNGAVIICHDIQPKILAQLMPTWTAPGSGNVWPTVGIATTQTPGYPATMQWIQEQLAQGRLVLIACDGKRKELMSCMRGEEINLCPVKPLYNAVLVEPPFSGGGLPGNPSVPGVPSTPGMPGIPGVPNVPGPPNIPPPGFPAPPAGWGLPDFTSPNPPPYWPQGLPWPPLGGVGPSPQPGPQPQPQPQPGTKPAPGVPDPNPTPPPGWPPGVPYPPFGMPVPDFTQPNAPSWWPPFVPWPGAQGGGTKPGGPFTPPPGALLYQGPDGLWRHTIRAGDYASYLANWYAGTPYKTRELEQTNPELVLYKDANDVPQYKPWTLGQVLVLPSGWDGSKGIAPPLGPQPKTQSLRQASANVNFGKTFDQVLKEASQRGAVQRAPKGAAPAPRRPAAPPAAAPKRAAPKGPPKGFGK